jgi:hypothetical protein
MDIFLIFPTQLYKNTKLINSNNIYLIEEPILLEDKIKALMDIEDVIKFSKNPKEKIEHCDKLIKENNLPERSKELYKLIILEFSL